MYSSNKKQSDDDNSKDGVNIIIPPIAGDNPNNNDYIERVIENAKDSIEGARQEQLEKTNEEKAKVERAKTEEADKSKKAVKHEDKMMSENTARKLSAYAKMLIAVITILPLVQVLLLGVTSAKVYFIYSVITFVLIIFLSYACNQWSMLFANIAIIVMSVLIVTGGVKHGMVASDLSKFSVLRISYLNNNMPEKSVYDEMTEEEIREEFTGKFVYYYKYGCPDCLAINSSLYAVMSESGYEMIPIETRSAIGKQLLELYPVDEVPAGLILQSDGTQTKRVIYKTNDDGSEELDTKNLNELLNALDEEVSKDD